MRRLAVVGLVMLCTGALMCSGEEEAKVDSIDISGATVLGVSRGMNLAGNEGLPGKLLRLLLPRAYAAGNSLFKITAGGSVLEVTVKDEDGNDITGDMSPAAAWDAGPSWVVVIFTDEAYIVRKADNAAYKLPVMPPPERAGLSGQGLRPIQSDQAGNLYFIANSRVYKITVADPDDIGSEAYTPDTDAVNFFVADKYGNVAYKSFGPRRIRKAAGGLVTIGTFSFWRAPDGYLNCYRTNSDGLGAGVQRIVVGGTVTYQEVGSPFVTGTGLDHFLTGCMMEAGGKLFFGGGETTKVYELFLDPGSVINVPPYVALIMAEGGTDYFFCLGRDSLNNRRLYRSSAAAPGFSMLLDDKYDVYTFTARADDSAVFHALRSTDMKKVLGTVDAAGVVTILSASPGMEILNLDRIN